MEDFERSNRFRSNLLTIIDQELKSSHLKPYFTPKESTLIESFRVEFEESFNCSQANSVCVEKLISDKRDSKRANLETQSAVGSFINSSASSLPFNKQTSQEGKHIIKENKNILNAICYTLRSKHAIVSKIIHRRTVALKTDIVNKKMMNQFRETIIQKGELRREKHNKDSKGESCFLNYETEGNIFEF